MASTSDAKLTQAQNYHPPSQPTVPAAALILASNAAPASMSDQRGFNWHEQREWAQTKNDMAMGTLAIEPVSHRPRARVSVLGAEDEDDDDDDDDDEDDEAGNDSDHENAFYILVSVIFCPFIGVELCALRFVMRPRLVCGGLGCEPFHCRLNSMTVQRCSN